MTLNVDYLQEPVYTIPEPDPKARHGGLPMRARPLAEPLTAHAQGELLDHRPYRILQNIDSISCYGDNNVAVDYDGGLWTWGVDAATAAALNESPDPFRLQKLNYIPQKQADHVQLASAGSTHTVYITESGELWGWGRNDYGQLGQGDKQPRLKPVRIMDNVCSVFANNGATFIIREDHSLWGCGANFKLYSGDRIMPKQADTILEPIWIMDDVVYVSAGEYNIMVIKTDGTLWGWGDYIINAVIPTPTHLMTNMSCSSVSPFVGRFCMAVAQNGDLYSFGLPISGSMVREFIWNKRGNFQPIKVLENVKKVVCGVDFSFILLRDGRLFSTGDNGGGQCGTGRATAPFCKPKLSMPEAKDACAGIIHGMGLQTNGDLWIWGGHYGLPKIHK